MEGSGFDEATFFRALETSGARVLVIGRRAMITLGVPVLTADYDLWVEADDIERLNAALSPLDLIPNYPPAEARRRGRYVLENDEHVDVLIARQQSTFSGEVVRFVDVWARRRRVDYAGDFSVNIPTIDDLILTKRWARRQKDLVDIQLLEALRREERS